MMATTLIRELERHISMHGDMPVIAGASLDTLDTDNNVDFWGIRNVVVAEDSEGQKDVYLIGAMK